MDGRIIFMLGVPLPEQNTTIGILLVIPMRRVWKGYVCQRRPTMARMIARPKLPAIERMNDLIIVSPMPWRGRPPLRRCGSP